MKDRWFRALTGAAALVPAISAGCVLGYVLWYGLPAIVRLGGVQFLLSAVWEPSAGLYGAAAFLAGTLVACGLAMALAAPVGLLLALSLRRQSGALRPALTLLAGFPSVLLGLWGLVRLTPVFGSGTLSAALVLAALAAPQIALLADAGLAAVDPGLRQSALALGASQERSLLLAELPAARLAVWQAMLTATLRVTGETTAVLLVAGNAAVMPQSISGPVRTLTGAIALEMGYAAGDHRLALFGVGAVLLFFTAALLAGMEALR